MTSKNKRARKSPITATKKPRGPSSGLGSRSSKSNSHQATQRTISRYHVLLKRRAALLRQLRIESPGEDAPFKDGSVSESSGDAVTRAELVELEKELESLGGIEAYQRASVHGQSQERGGDSSKVLVQWLRERKWDSSTCAFRRTPDGTVRKARCLEIGALKPDNLASCSSWLENRPIDLNSLHPDIEQQDFFERPLPSSDDGQFDLVSCSLVLNFVPEAERRGLMLRLIHRHLLPHKSSLLFLVLPLPCVTNTRYLNLEALRSLMRHVGFEQVEERWRPGGKVGYWLYSWVEPATASTSKPSEWSRKRVLQDGPKRNNFTILLNDDHGVAK